MTKKKIIIVSSIVVVLLLIIAGAVMSFGFKDEVKPTPANTAAPTPTTLTPEEETKKFENLLETKQFQEGAESEAANFFSNGSLNQLQPPYLTLAAWTSSQYVKNAIANPYFASGWWEAKDSYRQGSIDTYVSPYLSDELNAAFSVKDLDKAAIQEKFNGKIFFPDSGLQIAPQCFETWEDGTCFSSTPEIIDFSYEGLSETSVRINMAVSTSALYQKPDSPEGNLIAQDRVYNLSFVLSEKNLPETKDSEIPIMIIDSIDSSLEIRGTSDYLINES